MELKEKFVNKVTNYYTANVRPFSFANKNYAIMFNDLWRIKIYEGENKVDIITSIESEYGYIVMSYCYNNYGFITSNKISAYNMIDFDYYFKDLQRDINGNYSLFKKGSLTKGAKN